MQQYFSYIMAISFSDGRSRSTWREPPTMGMQLVNFITCGCESSAPFFVIYKAGREPMPYWWYAYRSCYVILIPNSLSHPGPSAYSLQTIMVMISSGILTSKSSVRITMWSSFLPPDVCRRAHVLFTLFVFACI